ncbi:MAG: DNA-3-methyladenine glycosylase [Ignavibacteria bacterium]
MILQRSFYQRETIIVARDLLGKILVHESKDGKTAGRIVETEAYCGPEDRAAHSFDGRMTARNEVMYGQKGVAYVYFIYGLYYCINVTSGKVEGKPEAVLLRALEPVVGEEIMAKRRGQQVKVANLSNGPSKLCMAMGISRTQNKADLSAPPLFIEDAPLVPQENIVEATRVGIDYSGDWKTVPWRFYIRNNRFVSKK